MEFEDYDEEVEEESIEPNVPQLLEKEPIQVYIPKASTTEAGIASFRKEDFFVDPKGEVSLSKDLVLIAANTQEALDNSEQAVNTANEAKEIAQDALEHVVEDLGTVIYVGGVLQSEVRVEGDIQGQFNQLDERVDSIEGDIQGQFNQLDERVDSIEEKIPNQASAENQLADKNFVNSSINSVSAFYITYNAQGDPFPTKAALDSATVFYSGGEERVPTTNDYCLVNGDETQDGGAVRYTYQGGVYPEGQWEFQYLVNGSPFTAAQLAAINSGITAELVQILKLISYDKNTDTITI